MVEERLPTEKRSRTEQEIRERTLQGLPFFAHLSAEQREQLLRGSRLQHFSAGDILHDHHADCLGMVTVITGSLRVCMASREGREITIYRLESGDTDILSASCVINQLTFDSMMEAETDAVVLVIPAALVSRLQKENIYLHSFIYELTAARFSDAMWTMQQILFLRMDQRVASALLDEYARTDDVHIRLTQEKLARRISSAREVVTRVLRRMERDHLLQIGRGCIELTDIDGLEKLLED